MRILITGINGFVGGHLLERVAAEGEQRISGISRSGSWPKSLAHLSPMADLRAVDLLDRSAVADALQTIRPERIYHLAGFSDNRESFDRLDDCYADNVLATRNLLQAAAGIVPHARLLIVSTGLVYGEATGEDDAFDESRPLRPKSPYASSKAEVEQNALDAFQKDHQPIIRVRPFNHIGPRNPVKYAAGRFARQVANVMLKRQPPIINTGDLSALRDFSDVRDVVEAYVLAMEQGRPGEVYNIGSGIAVSIRELLNCLVSMADVQVDIRQKPDPNRAGDAAATRCNAAKIRNELGWQPRFDLSQTARDTLNYCLENPAFS